MTTWLTNPPKARRKRRPPAGYSSWSSWSKAMRARQHRKGNPTMAKKRHHVKAHTRHTKHGPVHVKGHASNPKRYYRRRRNEPGLAQQVMRPLAGGLWVVGGKIGVNTVTGFVTQDLNSTLGMALRLGLSVAVGFLARGLSEEGALLLASGGVAGVYESVLKTKVRIPIVSSSLAGADYGFYVMPTRVTERAMAPAGMGWYNIPTGVPGSIALSPGIF